jgi:hypothetical protein
VVHVRLYASCLASSEVNKSKRHQDITFFFAYIPIVFQVFYLRYVSRLKGVKILAFDASYKDVGVVCMEACSSLHGSLLACLTPGGLQGCWSSMHGSLAASSLL